MDLTCPKCSGAMRSYERNGVTVEQCIDCRGLFLDRGELERLVDAENRWHGTVTTPPPSASPAEPPYIASSARRSSSPKLAPSSGATAMPMLALTRVLPDGSRNGSATACSTASATRSATSLAVLDGRSVSSSRNSSPPWRATRSSPRTTERRRWYTRVGTAAVACALAASVATVLIVDGLQDDGPLLESVPVTVTSTAGTADAHLVAHTWGTEIKLDASGLEAGATYTVAVVTVDGQEHAAGEFVGTGAQPMHCNLNSGVLRPDAIGFVVLDDSGAEVLASTFGA